MPVPKSASPVRLDCRHRGWAARQADGGDKAGQSQIGEGLLRRRWKRTHRRPARAQPPADQTGDQGTASAAERQRNRAELDTEQSDQQAGRETAGEKGDVGTIAEADRLSDPG